MAASGSRRRRTYASSRPTTPRTDDCSASEIWEDTRSVMSGRQAIMASAAKSAPRCSSLPDPPLVHASLRDARTGPATITPETVDRSNKSRASAGDHDQPARITARPAATHLMLSRYMKMLNSRYGTRADGWTWRQRRATCCSPSNGVRARRQAVQQCQTTRQICRSDNAGRTPRRTCHRCRARNCSPLGRWRRFDTIRSALMRAELERIVDTPGLSKDVFEQASKSLEG